MKTDRGESYARCFYNQGLSCPLSCPALPDALQATYEVDSEYTLGQIHQMSAHGHTQEWIELHQRIAKRFSYATSECERFKPDHSSPSWIKRFLGLINRK